MSLINKMLQDLDERKASGDPGQPLAGDVHAVSASAGGSSLRGVLVAVVAVVVAGGVAWYVLRPQPVPAPPLPKFQAPLAAANPTAAPQPAPAGSASAPVVVAAASAPAAAASASAVPAPAPATAAPASGPITAKPMNSPPPSMAAVATNPVAGALDAVARTQAAVTQMEAAVAQARGQAPAAAGPASSTPPAPAAPAPAAAKVATPAKPPGPIVRTPAHAVAEELASTPGPAPGTSQKRVSPQQLSDNLYKQAVVQLQQGKPADARLNLQRSLEANAANLKSRELLFGLQVEAGNLEDAAALMREGLKLAPEYSGFSMSLARLQLEGGDVKGAIATLERGLKPAGDNPEYHALMGAALQRSDRHEEAVREYLVALRSDPASTPWLVGVGISLQATGKKRDAIEAFQRAKDTGMLSGALAQFVDQRLAQLR